MKAVRTTNKDAQAVLDEAETRGWQIGRSGHHIRLTHPRLPGVQLYTSGTRGANPHRLRADLKRAERAL